MLLQIVVYSYLCFALANALSFSHFTSVHSYVAPFYEKQKFIVPANSPLYFCYVLVYCFGEQIQHLFFSIVHFSLCVQCAHVCVYVYIRTIVMFCLVVHHLPKQYIIKRGKLWIKMCVCVCVCVRTHVESHIKSRLREKA